MNEENHELEDEEIDEVVADLTADDLRERSQALHEAQEVWEELAYLATEKIPCPECAGAGAIAGGSLGDICPNCFGARVIAHPGSEEVPQPPWAQLRSTFSAYERGELPAAKVPTMEDIANLRTQGKELARKLGEGKPLPELREFSKPKGMLGDGDGFLGDYSDADLDAMEAEIEDE